MPSSEPKEKVMDEALFDVVVIEYATGRVDRLVGYRMLRDRGFHNAEKRLTTVLERSNDRYGAAIVPTGSHRPGDVLKES